MGERKNERKETNAEGIASVSVFASCASTRPVDRLLGLRHLGVQNAVVTPGVGQHYS
jgi:hypothetical protein